jgi:glycerate 2-kinase
MSIFRNRAQLLSNGNIEGRRTVLDILETGLAAGDPYENVKKVVRIEGNKLLVGSDEFPLGPMKGYVPTHPRPFPPPPLVFDLDKIGHIYLLGGGKAAQRQAKALEDVLGDLITEGQVNAKKGDSVVLTHAHVTLAGHPNPDEDSVLGAQRIVDIGIKGQKNDVVFFSESGGGTALMTLPAPGLTLQDVQDVNRILYLEHGAPMMVANAVRFLITTLREKHSRFVGDATLVMLSTDERPPANREGLAKPRGVSDEYDHAIYLLKEYNCWDEIPEAVRQHLLRKDPAHGTLRQEEWYDKPHFRIRVMGPEYMLAAAERCARDLGLNSTILASSLSNLESRIVGDAMGHIANEVQRHDRPFVAPCAFFLGGELVVNAGAGAGAGGRNSEFVAAAAVRIAGSKRIVIASGDSDGSDGPTDYAGGIVDGYTVERAQVAGMDVNDELRVHNTSGLLSGLGDALDTGILSTNVQDLRVIYVGPAA